MFVLLSSDDSSGVSLVPRHRSVEESLRYLSPTPACLTEVARLVTRRREGVSDSCPRGVLGRKSPLLRFRRFAGAHPWGERCLLRPASVLMHRKHLSEDVHVPAGPRGKILSTGESAGSRAAPPVPYGARKRTTLKDRSTGAGGSPVEVRRPRGIPLSSVALRRAPGSESLVPVRPSPRPVPSWGELMSLKIWYIREKKSFSTMTLRDDSLETLTVKTCIWWKHSEKDIYV